jgi:dTDP-4-amino-4,6-dideoxygalactose transaminase
LDSEGNITEVGINAKLNEYQCAVGLTLLDDIDKIIEHRSMLFNTYRTALQDVVKMPNWSENSSVNGAYMPIKLNTVEQRMLVEKSLKEKNIQCRQYFSPTLDAVFEKKVVYSNQNSEKITQRILCLPLHYYMTIEDVKCVVESVKRAVR